MKMTGQNKGFQISLDTARNILKIRLWGLWNVEMGKKYAEKLKEQIKSLNKKEEDWHLLMDLVEYSPQSQETQNIISEGLAFLKDYKIRKRAILIHRTPLQFPEQSLSQKIMLPIYSYFKSEDDAIRWLLDETDSL
jgi:hypothetical protein